jgi:hypothetical protein
MACRTGVNLVWIEQADRLLLYWSGLAGWRRLFGCGGFVMPARSGSSYRLVMGSAVLWTAVGTAGVRQR